MSRMGGDELLEGKGHRGWSSENGGSGSVYEMRLEVGCGTFSMLSIWGLYP